jgi:hypothetical protein
MFKLPANFAAQQRGQSEMSILQLAMLAIVLPGLWKAYSGLSGLLTNKVGLGNGKMIAFVVVVVLAGIIAAPTLTLGLPNWFRLANYAVYIGLLVTGAVAVWGWVQSAAAKVSRK